MKTKGLLWLALLLLPAAAWGGPYDAPASYYNSATGTGATLKAQLNDIIDGHTVYNYDSARSILQILDEDPNDPNRMLLVYNRASLDVSVINPGGPIPGWDSGVSWNREHTWPQSRGVSSSGPDYSDLFNLRPGNPSVNSARGNKSFGGAYGGTFGAVTDFGFAMWYPGNADAGMIARQQFYMATRYDGTEANTTNLELYDGDPNPAISGLGTLNRMLEWHYRAVPDEFELRRSHMIYTNYQGNRNPFVDHPEYVWSVFADQQNDSQLYVGGSPDEDGASTTSVDLGRVIVGGAVPAAQNVTLNRNGMDGTYYEVTTAGAATSSVTGRLNAFAINTTGTDSRTLSVGLSGSTATAGLKSGTVSIDNLDITTAAGDGLGANDALDTINVALDVLDHAEPSFAEFSDINSLVVDFGAVDQGAAFPVFEFDIYNLIDTAGFTAALDFDSFLGTGDTSVLTTDLLTFANLDAGTGSSFSAILDTTNRGEFSATYNLSFSDENIPGASLLSGLTLTLMGRVRFNESRRFDGRGPNPGEEPAPGIAVVPEPSSISLALVAMLGGALPYHFRRSRTRAAARAPVGDTS